MAYRDLHHVRLGGSLLPPFFVAELYFLETKAMDNYENTEYLTSYDEKSLSDILDTLEDVQKETLEVNGLLVSDNEKLKSTLRYKEVPGTYQLTIDSSIRIMKSFLDDLKMIVKSVRSDSVSNREVALLDSIGRRSSKMEREFGRSFREEYRWKQLNDETCKLSWDIYKNGRDYFIGISEMSLMADRLETYVKSGNENSIHIGRNSGNIQIQQDVNNSTMNDATDDESLKEFNALAETLMEKSKTVVLEEDMDAMKVYLNQMRTELKKDKPNRSLVKNMMSGLRNIGGISAVGDTIKSIEHLVESIFHG